MCLLSSSDPGFKKWGLSFFVYSGVQHVVTWRMSYKSQKLITLHEHLHSQLVLVGSVFLIFLFLVGSVFLIFLVFCLVLFALFVFILCLMNHMLSISLDCKFLIIISVVSNVYCKLTLQFIWFEPSLKELLLFLTLE